MSKTNVRAFQHVLQDSIPLEDQSWSYRVPNLPRPSTLNSQQLIKSITLVSNSVKQQIVLRLQVSSLNRAISRDPLDRFISISFVDFRLRVPPPLTAAGEQGSGTKPATARESADYIVKLLRSGVTLNDVHYNFYGHSNSQLKSRTCILFAAPKPDISKMVEGLGDFTKMKTVAKKSKRIGLLFSVAQMATTVDPNRCEDIQDIEANNYIFTDGCGLISPHLAHELSRKVEIAFRNVRYTPSVFQIRYRGYKGVVMLDPSMRGKALVKFRKSMKKFSGGSDCSFSVVDYSKVFLSALVITPYGFGYLNDEIVLLLHALGIQATVLLQKQADHFKFLASAAHDPRAGFRFLTYTNNPELAEKVLMDSIELVQPTITKLVNAEYDRMLNKRDEQRCRILIPKSRLLFGICDAWDVLKEGECAVKITMDGDGQPRALKGMGILVTRNPCLHPGDLQKFKVVERDELAHLVDCIVFPTRGRRPAADLMSGGDLDGDTFFVCWDSDLVPDRLSQPAQYPGAKEPVMFKAITDDDRLEYFARYTNASLGRSPPRPPPNAAPFILDVLHDAAKGLVQARQDSNHNYDGYSFDAIELLLSRGDVAMSEFELVKLTYRWCRKNNTALMDFMHLFDVNLLAAEEKAWTLNQLPPSAEVPSLIMNALCQSNLIQGSELCPFKLDYPGLRWKRIYDSSQDRLATFLDTTARALELFHRKLIVIRVDDRLTSAIYVPQKIERRQECQVDDRVRLFAFPHSQDGQTSHRLTMPTKMNYRLYCDGNVFQLFERTRSNSWIYIVKSPSNDSGYRSQETISGWRKGRQAAIDSGLNYDCRASIALDKFSRGLQRHIGRVNRSGVLGAEIYVISNRDVKSMQNLDLWLEFIDTKEVMPLFEREAKEYSIPKLRDVDWSEEPEYLIQIVKEKEFAVFMSLHSEKKYIHVFGWLLERGEKGLLLQCFKYLLTQLRERQPGSDQTPMKLQSMLDFLQEAPFLSATFARMETWAALPPDVYELLRRSGPKILQAHILSANEMQEFVVEPFKAILSQIQSMSLTDFAELVELISLTVRSVDIALDLLLECLEPVATRILPRIPALTQHFVRNLMGIALDHIDEAAQPQNPRKELLDLKLSGASGGYPVVESRLRIDAPINTLASSDHVRLTAASLPVNTATAQLYLMDALVESSQAGLATFRCFHPLPQFVEQCSWELRNCGSFVTTKTMFDAIHNLATQLQGCCGISDQILGTHPDAPSDFNMLPTGYVAKKNLNASQNAAVDACLSYPLTCLWGPPGTGKTYTIVEIIKQLQSSPENRRILVTAPTHNAVDNVMRKYMADTKTGGCPDRAHSIALRVSTDVRKVAEDLKKYTCDAMAGKEIYTSHVALNKARDQIKKCRLIFTTCIGAGLGLLRSELFDTVIIDEASQQTEAASLVPLVKGCQKAILVGDHVQLGATVQKHAVLQQFDISLFERLYTQQKSTDSNPKDGSTRSSSPIAKVMLDTQYRMHESICRFSSDEFYESKLRTGISNNARPLSASNFPWPSTVSTASGQAVASGEKQPRMIFVECSMLEDLGRKSKSNEGQAKICLEVCKMLCTEATEGSKMPKLPATQTPKQSFIAVLTPYSRQVELLKSKLSHFPNVEVSSIDGFQGREADIVVFVTVRCNTHHEIGFLKDLRRMNVALTRARAAMIVIGHRTTLTMGTADPESTAVWKRLLDALVEIKIPYGG
ncbi:related to NAM7-nonsense-mediated mRNA decay protein (RdRP) [Phialocephala subalpina]|uniref:Related to NAM7-nonsense-mediated mRNA decay protein (RdRP) n=1 Tax=Phialocephala subalpina TaxID=576137 RepID=A0A1L7WYJ8_9HELO|nr:related to NAM7-nonsense-mediated mRNA decay protein (RdRP) [Phialocephala subalpina]